jgi:hypothetical protein
MRLLPKTPRGTWALAGAVWLAGCGALWWALPYAPHPHWAVPTVDGEKWDFATGPEIITVRQDQSTIAVAGRARVFSMDAKADIDDVRLDKGPIQIFDLPTGRELRRYFTRDDSFRAVTPSPDGRWLALVGRSGMNQPAISTLDLDSDRTIDLPDADDRPNVSPVAFIPGGTELIYSWSRGNEHGLRAWDLVTERITREITLACQPVAIAANGRALAFVAMPAGQRVVRVVDWPSCRTLADFSTGDDLVRDLRISADGGRVAAIFGRRERSSGSHRVRIRSAHCWDVATRTELLRYSGQHMMRLTADGRTLVTYSWSDRTELRRLIAWDLATGLPRWEKQLPDTVSVSFSGIPGNSAGPRLVMTKSHQGPWKHFEDWAERKGINWPFPPSRWTCSSDWIDIESGDCIATVPADLGGADWMNDGTTAVVVDEDSGRWQSPRIQVWDVPPRKSLAWFATGAAVVTGMMCGLARWRVRRLETSQSLADS